MFQNISKHIKYHKLVQDISNQFKKGSKYFKLIKDNSKYLFEQIHNYIMNE
jgi:hypothetical protein